MYWVNEFTLFPIVVLILVLGGFIIDVYTKHQMKKEFIKKIWFPYDLEEYKKKDEIPQVNSRFIPKLESV